MLKINHSKAKAIALTIFLYFILNIGMCYGQNKLAQLEMIEQAAWNTEGKVLAVLDRKYVTAYRFNFAKKNNPFSLKKVKRIEIGNRNIFQVCLSKNGKRIAALDTDGKLTWFEVDGEKEGSIRVPEVNQINKLTTN